MDKDITEACEFGDNDGGCLPLRKCACGREFGNWDFIVSEERSCPKVCPCGRKLYFKNTIRVYEVVD